MRVAFVTVGETSRLTGGYLYHARVFAGLREKGVEVETLVASGAAPAEQEAAAPRLGTRLDLRRFDAIVVDALARIVCAPWLDGWRASHPVVAMVHELPSIAAAAGGGAAREQEFEEPLLRADRLVVVSDHGRSILQSRGVPAERIRVVSPGFDRLSPLNTPAEHAAREDSLVRALWAGGPFIWQLYPQADGAHAAKLEAFLDLFLANADPDLGPALRRLFRRWNGAVEAGSLELPDGSAVAAWQRGCDVCRDSLASAPDLTTGLMRFVASKR